MRANPHLAEKKSKITVQDEYCLDQKNKLLKKKVFNIRAELGWWALHRIYSITEAYKIVGIVYKKYVPCKTFWNLQNYLQLNLYNVEFYISYIREWS